jgi:hypothetical protein
MLRVDTVQGGMSAESFAAFAAEHGVTLEKANKLHALFTTAWPALRWLD